MSIGNGNISTFKMNIKAILFSIQGFNQGWKKDWPHYNDFLFYTTEFRFLRWYNREFHRVLSIKVTKIQYLSCLETFETILQPLEQVNTKGSFDPFKSRKKKKKKKEHTISFLLTTKKKNILQIKVKIGKDYLCLCKYVSSVSRRQALSISTTSSLHSWDISSHTSIQLPL